jgi:C4-dicarboxylate transporter, DctM subunit
MVVILIICFSLLLISGVPIIFALVGSAFTSFLFLQPSDLKVLAQILFSSNESFALLAIPLFILSGSLMSTGGMSSRLVNFFEKIVGFMPGGLAIVAVFACAFFAAISGSAPATVAAIGGMMIPSMTEKGYDKAWTTCLLSTSGSLGAIIPPSIPFVLFGVLSATSISALFAAGVIPGLFIGICYCIYSASHCHKTGIRRSPRYSLKKVGKSFLEAFWALMMPVIILGGIYLGVFTPTEAATVSVVYAIIIGLFVYRELRLHDLSKAFLNSAKSSAAIMMIITTAAAFATVLNRNNIPTLIGETIIEYARTPATFFAIFSVFMIILGMFMSVSPALVILTPILAPAAAAIGINPIHFGIVFIVLMVIGTITPPFGSDLFIACGISKISINDVLTKVWPFIFVYLFCLMILIVFPSITLFLPRLLGLA